MRPYPSSSKSECLKFDNAKGTTSKIKPQDVSGYLFERRALEVSFICNSAWSFFLAAQKEPGLILFHLEYCSSIIVFVDGFVKEINVPTDEKPRCSLTISTIDSIYRQA